MDEMNCPNCNGTLHISSDKMKMICDYCDSAFEIKTSIDPPKKQEENSYKKFSPAQKLFDIQVETFNEKAMEAWKEMCAWINDNDTVETFMNCINTFSKNKNNVYTNCVNKELLRTAEMRVASQLSNEEVPLVFVNHGILSKGKDGFLLTDKAIYKITKKNIVKLVFDDFHSLFAEPDPVVNSSWYFNGNKNLRFYATGCTDNEIGVILALICTLARDCHAEGYKITIANAT